MLKEFMVLHPELESGANKQEKDPAENDEKAEMKGVVSLLKKINPFSR